MGSVPVKKPNLVIFMPDQLRYDSLGCFGNELVKTPHIDALASRGTKFTNCFLQASVCSQSRCSMFTGTYPHVTGHRSLEYLIKPWEPNLFRSLKEDGYHVAFLAPRGDTFAPGVTELSVNEYGFLEDMPELMPPQRFDPTPEECENLWNRLFYKGLRDNSAVVDYDEACVRSAIQWLESAPSEPFVLFLPLLFPHCPFTVEEPYFSMYDRSKMPAPVAPESKTGHEPRYMAAIRERYGTGCATLDMWREITATYYGMISRLDDQFGRVVDAINAFSASHPTYTFFFTDHGEYLGDSGLIEKWPSGLSETLVREPLIIAGPGIPQGESNDSLCEMVDLIPTIFELCGIKESFGHNGKSLVPTIHNRLSNHKDYVFSEGGFLKSEEPLLEESGFPYDLKSALQHEDTTLVGKAISCRDKNWCYVYRLYENPELYDRNTDPKELHNLAGLPQYAHIESMFREVILRWMVETSDVMPWTKDPRKPAVNLESPKVQAERRLAEKQKA
ncbi:arylsulfatase A [Xylogone sp. PMI_703]|nr:arylsulfatase A [Xylogone sp. PMI_703]